MNNFVYDIPVKVYFGENQLHHLSEELAKFGKRVLLTYGGGSIKRTGLYDAVVAEVKKAWLAKHLPSVKWNAVNVVPYGYNKANFAESAEDVLFDDEKPNRDAWTGKAYDVNNILEILKKI